MFLLWLLRLAGVGVEEEEGVVDTEGVVEVVMAIKPQSLPLELDGT